MYGRNIYLLAKRGRTMENEFRNGFKRFKAEQARLAKARQRRSIGGTEGEKPLYDTEVRNINS